MENRLVSMKQIAELAGVSTATVSRALRNQSIVDEKTRQRIVELADRMQYRPNNLVHGVIQGKIKMVAQVMSNSAIESSARIHNYVQNHLYDNGYPCMIYNTQFSHERELECIRNAVEYRVSGLIIAPTDYNASEEHFIKLREHGTPFVILGAYGASVDVPHVHVDNKSVARDILDYLTDLGHKEIIVLGGPEQSWPRSVCGHLNEHMQAIGITDADERFRQTRWGVRSGYETMSALLDSKRKVSAIIAISDQLAIGAIQAIRERGLSVPDDISIIGRGNSKLGQIARPYLTTVDTSQLEVAKLSSNILLEMMQKSGKDQRMERLYPVAAKLIIRQSSGPAPAHIVGG